MCNMTSTQITEETEWIAGESFVQNLLCSTKLTFYMCIKYDLLYLNVN